jgi:hypothetical protein
MEAFQISTDRGVVDYARFCGGRCEHVVFEQESSATWIFEDARRIKALLSKLGIKYRVKSKSADISGNGSRGDNS